MCFLKQIEKLETLIFRFALFYFILLYLYIFLKSDNIESKNIKYRFSLAYSKKCFLLFLCLIMFI